MAKLTGYAALQNCDKYDYYLAAFCGISAGIIDVLFVNRPGASALGKASNDVMDSVVKSFAKLCGWNPRLGQEGNIASAIGFLEKKFPVNYDMTSANFMRDGFTMGTTNHHIKSLAHSPDIIGLFFSIVDQFNDTGTFLSDGRLIVLDTKHMELRGSDFPSKLVAAICNWFGHVMSDVVGSSGSRGNNGTGSGVPLPFYEMFLSCNFGSFQVGKDRQDLAVVMTRVFQEGYDLRFGIATAVPVVLNELIIRCAWVLKRHYYHGLTFDKCVPKLSNTSLHKMLLIAHGSFCLVDGIAAGMKGGGNAVTFLLHLNLTAWLRFLDLVFQYIAINPRRIEYEIKHQKNIAEFKQMDIGLNLLKKKITDFCKKEKIVIDNNRIKLDKAISEMKAGDVGIIAKDMGELFGFKMQFNNRREFDRFMLDSKSMLEL
ncbi:MAG: hypothetical protein IJ849_04655 [Selenomonadaceae bacterium]|nr:hypothetical protein [Selenomonadaceae bacterium]